MIVHGGGGDRGHEYVVEPVPEASSAEVRGHGDDDDGGVGDVQSAQFFQTACYLHSSLDQDPESSLVLQRSALHVSARLPSSPSLVVPGNNTCDRLHLSYQARSQGSRLARDDDYGGAAEPVSFAPLDLLTSSR